MLKENQNAALLEFFRNLTPQILFAGCALYVAVQLDFTTFSFDWADVKLTGTFYACLALSLASLTANVSRFLDLFVSGSEKLDQAFEEVRQQEGGIIKKAPKILKAVWAHNKKGLIEAVVVVAIAYAGMIPVVTMAAHSALGLLAAGK